MFTAGTSPKRKRSVGKRGLKSNGFYTIIGLSLEPYGANCITMIGIIGKKIGMTSVFGPDGKQTACTIIEAGPNVVTQVKTKETDGYNAIQLGFGDKKDKHATAAEKNHFAKANTPAKKITREFRDYTIEKNIGETITVEVFTEGEKVSVVGTTKGKGFQGVVKRHGFHGVGGQSHGQHDRSRAPGSLGNSSDAARVMKGMRMAGRMGSDRVKLKGLKVVKIFADKNYILISGSVPGHINSIVYILK